MSSSSQGLLRRLRGANSKEEEQNKAVRAALLESLEKKFGKVFAQSVADRVDVNSPRSLDAKTVQELIKAGNESLAARQGLSKEKSVLHATAESLFDVLDEQTASLNRQQQRDQAKLKGMPEGVEKKGLQAAIERRADTIKQNNQFVERLFQGEHPTAVQHDMMEKKAILMNSDEERQKLRDANADLQKQAEQKNAAVAIDQQQDLQAYVQSFPPLKNPPPSVLPPLPGEQPQANVQSFAPLKNPPPSVLPPLPGEQPQANVQSFAPLKNPPPKVLPPLPDEQAAELKRSPSVRDDLNKKGAVSNNAFKLQDDAMKAGKSTRNNLPASNKPSAPAKGSSIKNG